MRIPTLLLSYILLSCVAFAQNEKLSFTVKGLIYDDKTNERLEGAAIICGDTIAALSDRTGFFQFSLNRKVETLKAKLVGYEDKTVEINADENETKLVIRLIPVPILLESVTITGEHFIEEPVVNSYTIHPGELSKIPQFIEVDAFKAFQALPGVTTAADFSSQISVHGGGYDETLVLLDGIPIYNPYHLIGAFSMFNSDILQNERLYLSNYPASYGGALSSILELNSKGGNAERIKGNLSLGLASAKATLDGPLLGGTFLLSARRTYFDIITGLMGVHLPYYFYDLYSKYAYPVSRNNLLTVSAFYSRDIYELDDEKVFVDQKEIPNWGNLFINLSDEYFFNEKSSAELKVFFSRASLGIDTKVFYKDFDHQVGILDTTAINNYINDFTTRLTFNFHPEGQNLSLGLEIKKQEIHYSWTIDETDLNGMYIHPLEEMFYDFAQNPFCYKRNEYYVNAFIIDKIILSKKSEITAGLRGSFMKNLNAFILLPSFTFSYYLYPNLKMLLGFGKYSQNTYSLKDRKTDAVFTPFMSSFLTENKGKIPYSYNYSLGLVFSNVFLENTSLEVESYYKTRKNIATSYGKNEELEFENGYAAGIDILLKREEGTVTGWIGYSLLRSVKSNKSYDYYAPFDRTHNVKILLNYALSNSWLLNSFWTYSTGLPYTATIGKYLGPPDDNSGYGY
ncbi:MAG: carboxypeptidase-like regulatory domain-containing protein, partial [Clostridiales bacterium]